MHLGNPVLNNSNNFTITYKNNDSKYVLESSLIESDLGILIDAKLDFNEQIKLIISKANMILSRLKKCFSSWYPKSFCILYSTVNLTI